MTVVVVDEFQSVHVDEREHYLLAVDYAVLENIVNDVDKSVAVVDVAERINDIELIKFVHCLAEVEKLSDILDRVADIHCHCVTEKALDREIAVADYVVTKTSLTEMQGQEVADVSARLEFLGVHLLACENSHAFAFAIVPDQGSGHCFRHRKCFQKRPASPL